VAGLIGLTEYISFEDTVVEVIDGAHNERGSTMSKKGQAGSL